MELIIFPPYCYPPLLYPAQVLFWTLLFKPSHFTPTSMSDWCIGLLILLPICFYYHSFLHIHCYYFNSDFLHVSPIVLSHSPVLGLVYSTHLLCQKNDFFLGLIIYQYFSWNYTMTGAFTSVTWLIIFTCLIYCSEYTPILTKLQSVFLGSTGFNNL